MLCQCIGVMIRGGGGQTGVREVCESLTNVILYARVSITL